MTYLTLPSVELRDDGVVKVSITSTLAARAWQANGNLSRSQHETYVRKQHEPDSAQCRCAKWKWAAEG
jgi:hypothetical protein